MTVPSSFHRPARTLVFAVCVFALAIAVVGYGARSVNTFRQVGATHETPVEVKVRQHEQMQSGVGIKGAVDCGSAGTVTVCTACGTNYDQSPIPGETFAECLARHRAQMAEVSEACAE